MTEFILNYGLFLAKTVTLVAAIVAVMYFAMVVAGRKREIKKEALAVRKINKKYEDMAKAMNAAMLPKGKLKKYLKEEKGRLRAAHKHSEEESRRKHI